MAPQCIVSDAEWLALLEEGLTSAEAEARTGLTASVCRYHARKLGKRWAPVVLDHSDSAERLRAIRMTPEFNAKRLAALRASKCHAQAVSEISRRRFGLDRLSAAELADYRALRRKKISRPEAARMIGRPDILLSAAAARAQRTHAETALGARMLAFLKAEGVHKPKLPVTQLDQDGPRAKRRAAVHRMVIDRPGILSREIAAALGCSPDTVDNDLAWLRNRRVIVRGPAGGHAPIQQKEAA